MGREKPSYKISIMAFSINVDRIYNMILKILIFQFQVSRGPDNVLTQKKIEWIKGEKPTHMIWQKEEEEEASQALLYFSVMQELKRLETIKKQ